MSASAGRQLRALRRWIGAFAGPPPTAATGHALADAYLWVKHPGDSDGRCNGAGRRRWWPEYAVGLARRAAW